MTVVGDVMLKHGKLVDLDLNCTGELSSSVEVYFFTEKYAPSMMQKTQLICQGTGPWLYCWHIMEKGYNITGNETCDDPQIMKRTCEFPILW